MRTSHRHRRHVFGAAVGCSALLLAAAPAHAELVFFSTGRTLSVRSYRVVGGEYVLSLRSGGEMVVDAAHVADISPDEVPYPEPDEPTASESVPTTPGPGTASLVINNTFDPLIRKVAAEEGVEVSLVRAVIQVESGYQPRARSPKGAVGLMQLLPATARRYGVRNLYDPSANVRAGVTHLKALLNRFPLGLALAAYNAGEAAVERFDGIPPFPETLAYVARIRALTGL